MRDPIFEAGHQVTRVEIFLCNPSIARVHRVCIDNCVSLKWSPSADLGGLNQDGKRLPLVENPQSPCFLLEFVIGHERADFFDGF